MARIASLRTSEVVRLLKVKRLAIVREWAARPRGPVYGQATDRMWRLTAAIDGVLQGLGEI